MYKILLERRAERDLDLLDPPVRKRVVNHLLSLQDNPKPSASKRLKGAKNAWRLRIGDWRVIYEVDDKAKEVKIYRIKPRAKAY